MFNVQKERGEMYRRATLTMQRLQEVFWNHLHVLWTSQFSFQVSVVLILFSRFPWKTAWRVAARNNGRKCRRHARGGSERARAQLHDRHVNQLAKGKKMVKYTMRNVDWLNIVFLKQSKVSGINTSSVLFLSKSKQHSSLRTRSMLLARASCKKRIHTNKRAYINNKNYGERSKMEI